MLIVATERLSIRQFTPNDHEFVLTLFNDESFLTNIGDKGVRNTEDAINHLINAISNREWYELAESSID